MNRFPSESFSGNMTPTFYWPSSLAWSPTGVMTVSSLYNGVWQRIGNSWRSVGGPVVAGPYVSGSIGWLRDGSLVVMIRRNVPPLPQTPSLQEDAVAVYKDGRWEAISDPVGVRPNLLQFLAMGPHGQVVMQEQKGNAVNLWEWQGGTWKEISDATAPVGMGQIGGLNFSSSGNLILDDAGYASSSRNGVYKLVRGRWVQILKNPNPLRAKDTYWFHHVALPGGRLVFSLLNQSGYHLWENRNGTWTNLGLDGQDVVKMGRLPGNRLYAITQEGVCWIRTIRGH